MYYSKYYEEDNKVKKFSLLLALVILGFSVCCAEAGTSFSLRSGIEFGDTKEEVFAKETKLERNSATSNGCTMRLHDASRFK